MKSSHLVLLRLLLPVAALTGLGAVTPAFAGSHVSVGVSIGAVLPHGSVEVYHGHDRYYYRGGYYYRHEPRGYVVVRPPIGVVVRDLPPRCTRIVVSSGEYYRWDDVYYRRVDGGWVVCDDPVEYRTVRTVVEAPAPVATPAPSTEYLSVWLDESEYFYKQGQFFKKTPDGLKWVEAPVGGVTKVLPANPQSVWFQEVEYFECDGAYFKKTPDGYKVVEAPWKKK